MIIVVHFITLGFHWQLKTGQVQAQLTNLLIVGLYGLLCFRRHYWEICLLESESTALCSAETITYEMLAVLFFMGTNLDLIIKD